MSQESEKHMYLVFKIHLGFQIQQHDLFLLVFPPSLIIYVHETVPFFFFKKEVLKKVTHTDVGWSSMVLHVLNEL